MRLLPSPPAKPLSSTVIRIDAQAGLTIPAPTHIDVTLSGDEAIVANMAMVNLTGDIRDRALREYWRSQYDFIDVKSTSATFDPATGEMRFAMDGLARMDWNDGWYETDGTSVGYKADFTRDPGPDRDAPFTVDYPAYSKVVETILLPPNFAKASAGNAGEVNQTVAGIEYHRTVTLKDNVFTVEKTERSIAPEFPAADAPAAQETLRALATRSVGIRRPANYQPNDAEMAASIKTTPTGVAGFLERGNTLLNRGKLDDAIKDFDQALAIEPTNVWALADRGITRVWKGDFVVARKDLDAAAAIDPRNPVVLRARGLLAERNGSPKEAVAAYTDAIAAEPGNTFALIHRATANRAAGNDDAALGDAAAALKLDPKLVDLYLLRANIYRNQGNRAAALAEAAAAAGANPTETYAQVVAANIAGALGARDDAMRYYGRALAIKPEAYIYLNRSIYRPKADVAGRLADVDAALKLDPASVDALATKADLLAEKHDFAGALALTTALAQSPNQTALLLARGSVYARSGQAAQAERDFAAVRSKATEANDLNSICWAKATNNVSLESALQDCDTALAKSPDIPAYLDSRAFVLLRLGRNEEAIASYDRALARSPRLAASLFGRAVAWARKGDRAKSAADLAAAEQSDADVRDRFARYGVTIP